MEKQTLLSPAFYMFLSEDKRKREMEVRATAREIRDLLRQKGYTFGEVKAILNTVEEMLDNAIYQ